LYCKVKGLLKGIKENQPSTFLKHHLTFWINDSAGLKILPGAIGYLSDCSDHPLISADKQLAVF
jgi:hypothetical protein